MVTQARKLRTERILSPNIHVVYRNGRGLVSTGTAVRQGCGNNGYYYVLADDTIICQKNVISQQPKKEG